MRRCSNCGSISQDDERSCGVCRRSLSDLPSLSLEQATRIQESSPPVHLKRGISTVGVVEVLSGTAVIGLGVLSLIAGPLGSVTFRLGLVTFPLVLVLWLGGLSCIVVGISSVGQRSRPIIKGGFGRGGPITRPAGGRGWEQAYREADREKAEDHRKETGEAD